MSDFLTNERFPRTSAYNPDWLIENPMGAHPLWLTEWLCERIALAGVGVREIRGAQDGLS